MKCRYIEKNLLGYIENTLPSHVMTEINIHLEKCNECKHLLNQVKLTYGIFDLNETEVPELFTGIQNKLKVHSTTVVEFIPQHRVLYRFAASVVIIVGVALGILIGGKYSTTQISKNASASEQLNSSEYSATDSESMDGESDLAVLYPND
jgi:hypothetical protein